MAVLLAVRAVSVPVFEVEPEVLDGLAFQLLSNQRMDPAGEIAVETGHSGQVVGGGAPLSERLKRKFPELLCSAGPEQMRAPIDRVNGLSVRPLAGKIGRQTRGYRVEALSPSGQ
jgi:hypothetical protein